MVMAQLSQKLPWELAQTKWSSILNPILALPMLNGNQVQGVALTASAPLAVNHLLGRMPVGWFLTDNTANAVVWRAQPFNQFSIILESDADTLVSFWIF